MGNRLVRMGVDVRGTHVKAVAIGNATREIIGELSVKTTHDDRHKVAAGAVKIFQNCLKESGIVLEDVTFVAYSTTQAISVLTEDGVACMGMLGMGPGGMKGSLAKHQTRLEDIDLRSGRSIKIKNYYLSSSEEDENAVKKAVGGFKAGGAQVLAASDARGADDIAGEQFVLETAYDEVGMETTVALDIIRFYDLTRWTRTVITNAGISSKMLNTANPTEESVRKAGVEMPLMTMRGDSGVMEINEMRKRPVLTMLSGPAASVMGSLMCLRASNGVYFEVGGTTTNTGVTESGRSAIDYSVVGGHKICISSLDVWMPGAADGSIIRINKGGAHDVGPCSVHIAGLDYVVFTDGEEIVELRLEFFPPKEGDLEDYAVIHLKSGKHIIVTSNCAASALGLVTPKNFSYGSVNSARKAMQPIAGYPNTMVEDVASQILTRACRKIEPIIMELTDKHCLEHDQISLVGAGSGIISLTGFCANKVNIRYSVPENVEVISSIGMALTIARDVVERMVPNLMLDDINSIRREVMDRAVGGGTASGFVKVYVEIDPWTSKLIVIMLGSMEVRTIDLLKECSEKEARNLAAEDLRFEPEELNLAGQMPNFYVYNMESRDRKPLRILDRRGFVRVQRTGGKMVLVKASSYRSIISRVWEEMVIFKADAIPRPDYYLCADARAMNFSDIGGLERALMLMDTEIQVVGPSEDIVIVGAKNQL